MVDTTSHVSFEPASLSRFLMHFMEKLIYFHKKQNKIIIINHVGKEYGLSFFFVHVLSRKLDFPIINSILLITHDGLYRSPYDPYLTGYIILLQNYTKSV